MQHSSSSNSGSSSSRTPSQQCIVVLVAAYSGPWERTFDHTFYRMDRVTSCKVVVVSCLTLVPNPGGGIELPVDSVEPGWRDKAIRHQLRSLSYCVGSILHVFHARQSHLQIIVERGASSEEIAMQVARVYRPRWIIVDRSLLNGRQGKQFQLALKKNQELRNISNLAFIPRSGEPSFETGAYFPSCNDQVTDASVETNVSREAVVEEHTNRSKTVWCCNGLFTLWQGSTSSTRRTLTRVEDQSSLRTRTTSREGNFSP
ncbi:unnamed protein product [Calypogeia fissa]